ncbi:OsmC family protein [Myxococcota bacterium]
MKARIGPHEVAIDFSEKLGGTDSAPTPTELFMMSVAACKLFYAHRFLARRDVTTDGAKASITWESSKTAIERAKIKVEIPGGIDRELFDDCMVFMSKCFVANSVQGGVELDSELG